MTVMPGTTASDRSSHTSPNATSPTPSWAPPRAPLPPHRLAKLANALGVPTPLPASHSYGSFRERSLSVSPSPASSSSFSDHFRRSPTPSATSTQTYTSTTLSSKYLLHVIPPLHLPHDSDILDDPDLLSPPPGASGYHTQFRRGVLVPVFPTLSSQLAAIAKEYALPSTMGLVLYLVISPASNSAACPDEHASELEEPGPRISDDIWRHVWLRVVHAEREENPHIGPRPIGLGLRAASSPSLLQDMSSASLHPVMAPVHIEVPHLQQPTTPSPSTATHSIFSSQSELEPPESMSSVSGGAGDSDDLPLPGLQSPALIPILAKVEFDVDRRKAAWYEPWLRSRRANHAKRAESRLGERLRRAESRAGDVEDEERETEESTRKAPMDLELVGRLRIESSVPSFLLHKEEEPETEAEAEYAQLLDDPDEEEDGPGDEDPTARLNTPDADPLADVFGTDAETWTDLHTEGKQGDTMRRSNPNVVDLALDGAALSALPSDLEDDSTEAKDEGEEVRELWDQHSRPSLVVSIPSPPSTTRRRSSSATTGTASTKRGPPPPLNLASALPTNDNLAVQGSPGVPSSSESAHLAYLEGETPPPFEEHRDVPAALSDTAEDEQLEDDMIPRRDPDLEKRDGAFFEDLDLGLEVSNDAIEYDEGDPHDRRRSQLIMRAQLDEIERNLIQLSPRRLQTESIEETSPQRPLRSATLSPPSQMGPPSLPSLRPAPSPDASALPLEGASWPAVPYTALQSMSGHQSSDSVSGSGTKSRPPSPPRIAFNGVSTEPPRGAFARRSRSGSVSKETLARQREQDERELYPPLIPPALSVRHGADSPIIPLSPDPFGRFPSEAEANRLTHEGRPPFPAPVRRPPMSRKGSVVVQDQFDPEERVNARTPSSRFSLDSVTSDDGGKSSKGSSLVSMKSIKKLWRKTNSKMSLSGQSTPVPDSGRSSPNYPNGLEQPSARRSSRSVSKSPQPNEFSDAAQPQPKSRRKASTASMQFSQDPRNSLVPTRTPPLESSRQPSPALPPLPSTTPSPLSSPQMTPAVLERNGNVRKSILKSWKSASGSLSVQTTSSAGTAGTPRSSTELLNDAAIKRRRPSLLDGGSAGRRGSSTSMSTTLVDIPPSPALPGEFIGAHVQSRKRSSHSNLLSNGARLSSVRPRPSPSLSSTSTVSSSSPPRPSRLTLSGSPPKNGRSSRASGESEESRPSFDTSQFEIVSPKLGAHMLENTLSYPYHTLDHSMTSME